MRLFLLFTYMFLSAGAARADGPWFDKQCPQAFQDLAQRTDIELRAASMRSWTLRRSRLNPPLQIKVGEELYTATHKLGESSGMVYLGRAPNGRTVVIKKYGGMKYGLNQEEAERMTRDVWAKSTVLAGEPGGPPKVLAVDTKRGRVVTEYITGLKLEEISDYHLGLTKQQGHDIWMELYAEQNRWSKRKSELGRAIREQMLKQDPPPSDAVKKLGTLPLDIEVRNFIYSFSQKRWVFFDP